MKKNKPIHIATSNNIEVSGAFFILLLTFILLGGFYEWATSIISAFLMTGIIYQYKAGKKLSFPRIGIILFLLSVLVTFWSIDYTENLLGILHLSAVLWWTVYCYSLNESNRMHILTMVPYMGFAMTGIGFGSLLFKNLYDFFWTARRFGGFFQYANTCALFLLIGIVILANECSKAKNDKLLYKYIVLAVLVAGLFATGSRSVMLLFILWCITKGMKIAVCMFIALMTAALYMFLSGDRQNLGRVFTLFTSNSTVFGRILYAMDAFDIIKTHPLGLGYMGYYYIQHSVQTGVYTTRYVHNDFLQAGLDYGIIAMVLAVWFPVRQLWKGKQNRLKKELLLIISIGALTDFHMQYLLIDMIFVLCFDCYPDTFFILQKKKMKTDYLVYLPIATMSIVYILFTVPLFISYTGDAYLALKFFPSYTKALEQELALAQDNDVAVYYADKLLVHNRYASAAYDAKAHAAAAHGNYEEAVKYKDIVLELERYQVDAYRQYDVLLNEMMQECGKTQDNAETYELLRKRKESLPGQLAALKKQTRTIAYRLRDQPVFDL